VHNIAMSRLQLSHALESCGDGNNSAAILKESKDFDMMLPSTAAVSAGAGGDGEMGTMTEHIVSTWRGRMAAAGLAAMIVVGVAATPTFAATGSGSATVQNLYDTLLSTMKNGRTLGESGRFVQLEPVIRRSFDVPTMARISVGPAWASMTEIQRQQITEGFGRYISAIYADRFDGYSGQKLEVTDEQPNAAGVIVHSQIVKANGDPVKVDYVMRRNGEAWLISDIYLDGAISEIATRRSEFSAILKSQGVDGLISALNRKADMLTGTTAKAF
jgi:phospholipid transport system substrate-binding protein